MLKRKNCDTEYDSDNNTCYICLTDCRDEDYLNPCSKNCSKHLVHKKCIYEWKTTGDSCPLCRSRLNSIDIPNLYNYKQLTNYNYRNNFIHLPIHSDIDMLRCFIIKSGNYYRFYVESPTLFEYPHGRLPTFRDITENKNKFIMYAYTTLMLSGYKTTIYTECKKKLQTCGSIKKDKMSLCWK